MFNEKAIKSNVLKYCSEYFFSLETVESINQSFYQSVNQSIDQSLGKTSNI